MNRGVFQGSLMQQMMGGSHSWWNMDNLRLPAEQTSPLLPTSSPSPPSFSSVLPPYLQPSHLLLPTPPWQDNQELQETWNQMLLGGLVGEEDKQSCFFSVQPKKLESWEDQVLYPSTNSLKHETTEGGFVGSHGSEDMQVSRPSWSHVLPASSPRSCLTSFSSSMLDFSNIKAKRMNHQPDHSSECNSTATGATFKKARVQTSSTQPANFKVRKEKLGDRITALHQLVSPFGKTDTASVLLEAIGYIRFLQGQIEALSSPYIGGSGSGSMRQPLLTDNSVKKRVASDQDANKEPKRDLRSRGLCLVPVACTMHVGSDNGADYWAPAFGGHGFR